MTVAELRPRLLNATNAARYLGVGPTTFYDRILVTYAEILRPVPLCGDILRYDRRDLDKVVAKLKALKNPYDGRLAVNKPGRHPEQGGGR